MTNELKEQRDIEPKKRRSQNGAEQPVETKGTRWVQIRLIPIWIRILLVLILLFVAAIVGVIIGYGYIGSGEPADALKWSTWQHILDIIEGKE